MPGHALACPSPEVDRISTLQTPLAIWPAVQQNCLGNRAEFRGISLRVVSDIVCKETRTAKTANRATGAGSSYIVSDLGAFA
jgi:hypothetical protein